jgi:hypothetical protein
MLVVFTNKSGGTVDMFEEVATDLIKLMGRRSTVPSAISAEDLPEALSTLQSALAELNNLETDEQEDSDEEDGESVTKSVGLSTRAHPLIELIQQSISDKSFLMWDFR